MIRCGALVVLACASAAGAQPPSDDHEKAVELFEDGRRLMKDHDPAAACAKFAESIRLEPLAAGTMLNLGLCHQQLGHYKTALYWFRKAQIRATETEPPLPAYEQAAREHTTHLAALVATIRIEGAPADAQVSIDDEPVRPEDYGHVELDPGHHVLIATSAGKTFRRELEVTGRGGQTVMLSFRDTSLPPPPPPPPETPPVDRTDTGDHQRRLALYVAAGGGALLAGSIGLTVYEKHVYNDNKDAASAGDAHALDETRNATDVARNWGTGLAVVGLIAAGVAGYLYFTAPDEVVVVAPTVAPGQVGATIAGRF